MKKYIIEIIIASVLVTVCALIIINSKDAYAGEPYIKASIGMNHIQKQKIKDNKLQGSLKLKQPFPVIGIGAGYEFDSNLRIETVFDYYFLFTQAEKSRLDSDTYNINLSTKISDLMLNIIQGIELSNKANLFVGGGIGISSITDEATGYKQDLDLSYDILQPTQGKHVYRFTYKVTTGIDYKLRDGVTGELTYNFYNLGKNKPCQVEGINNIQKRRFLIHNLTLGLRFNI
jgi:opacity protein-like surface antigen